MKMLLSHIQKRHRTRSSLSVEHVSCLLPQHIECLGKSSGIFGKRILLPSEYIKVLRKQCAGCEYDKNWSVYDVKRLTKTARSFKLSETKVVNHCKTLPITSSGLMKLTAMSRQNILYFNVIKRLRRTIPHYLSKEELSNNHKDAYNDGL